MAANKLASAKIFTMFLNCIRCLLLWDLATTRAVPFISLYKSGCSAIQQEFLAQLLIRFVELNGVFGRKQRKFYAARFDVEIGIARFQAAAAGGPPSFDKNFLRRLRQ